MAHKLMKHLNGNLLCAIDTETTGTDPQKHEMIQVAIIPLDGLLQPDANRLPFILDLKPDRPEDADPDAMDCNRRQLADLCLRGVDKWKAADLFDEWFENQKLGFNKRLQPLGANWNFDRDFIMEWLGRKTFNRIFDCRVRDIQTFATHLNDLCSIRGIPYAYQKVELDYICNVLRIERTRSHDAVDDARVTAECYRQMLQRCIYGSNLGDSQLNQAAQPGNSEVANQEQQSKISESSNV